MPERVENPVKGEEPPMAEDAPREAGKAVLKLRARWLEPSPPLAVDDEPTWTPPPDPVDEKHAAEIDTDQQVAPPLAS
jgi:hypothetical protein